MSNQTTISSTYLRMVAREAVRPGNSGHVRFQSSWADDTTKLSWAVTRGYAPTQGRFLSEDSLLGEPRDPDSRHLYAYALDSPMRGWDRSGKCTQAKPSAGANPFYPDWLAMCSLHEDDETSGPGAAIDAAVGLGLHSSFETAVAAMTRVAETREPDPASHAIYEDLYRNIYLGLYERLRPVCDGIRRITGYPPEV